MPATRLDYSLCGGERRYRSPVACATDPLSKRSQALPGSLSRNGAPDRFRSGYLGLDRAALSRLSYEGIKKDWRRADGLDPQPLAAVTPLSRRVQSPTGSLFRNVEAGGRIERPLKRKMSPPWKPASFPLKNWRPRRDSNSRSSGSKPDALIRLATGAWFGGSGRYRSCGLRDFNPALYRLSYRSRKITKNWRTGRDCLAHPCASPLRGLRETLLLAMFSNPQPAVLETACPANWASGTEIVAKMASPSGFEPPLPH